MQRAVPAAPGGGLRLILAATTVTNVELVGGSARTGEPHDPAVSARFRHGRGGAECSRRALPEPVIMADTPGVLTVSRSYLKQHLYAVLAEAESGTAVRVIDALHAETRCWWLTTDAPSWLTADLDDTDTLTALKHERRRLTRLKRGDACSATPSTGAS